MKHTLLIMILFSSTCAFAFGGSSFGTDEWFERKFGGVNSIGGYYGSNGKPDVDFVDCGSCAYAHPNTGVCTPKDPNATYDKNTKTCPCQEGYELRGSACELKNTPPETDTKCPEIQDDPCCTGCEVVDNKAVYSWAEDGTKCQVSLTGSIGQCQNHFCVTCSEIARCTERGDNCICTACENGYELQGNICVAITTPPTAAPCADFIATTCVTACTDNNGVEQLAKTTDGTACTINNKAGQCLDGVCTECNIGDTCGCTNGQVWNGTTCVECTTNAHCTGNANGSYCRTGITRSNYTQYNNTCGCTNNTHCNSDGNSEGSKYCHIITYNDTNTQSACYEVVTGTCASAPTLTAVQIKELDESGKQTENLLKTVYKDNTYRNWWSSANICLAHGKSLFNPEWLECNGYIGVNGSTFSGYCCPEGERDCNYEIGGQSERMQAFRKALDDGTYPCYWTSNGYKTKCTTQDCNSCNVFRVYANYGLIRYSDLVSNFYVLCE